MKKGRSKEQMEQLKSLAAMQDEDIDLSDIPEITDWTGAVRGKFYKPIKQPISLRLDADIIAWLRHTGRGYQSRINDMLREQMVQSSRKKAA